MDWHRHRTHSPLLRLLAPAVLLGLLVPCPAPAELRVAATTPDLGALARAVGGDRVRVEVLAAHTQDPHVVDARPSLALTLNRADLLLAVGLDLEVGWLPVLQVSARNARIQPGAPGYLDASRFVDSLEVPVGRIERSMGDVHPGGNPHYNVDPRAMAQVAVGIAARMQELDPAGRAVYDANLAAFLQRLGQARARWEQQLAPWRGRSLITYHRSWTYLLDWLGLVEQATIEPKPGIPPTPAHIAALVERAGREPVLLVLQESWYPAAVAALIAERLGVPLVRIPGASNFAAGEDYIAYMDTLVAALHGALAGRATP